MEVDCENCSIEFLVLDIDIEKEGVNVGGFFDYKDVKQIFKQVVGELKYFVEGGEFDLVLCDFLSKLSVD